MKKIKYKLTKSEVQALMLAINIACIQGGNAGLANMAAHYILEKLYLKLLGRALSLKTIGNGISFSIPELWALNVLVHNVMYLLGPYEKVLLDKINNEALRLTA